MSSAMEGFRECLMDLRLRRGIVRDDGSWRVPEAGKDPNGVSLSEQYVREMKGDFTNNTRRFDSGDGVSYEERGVFGVPKKGEGAPAPHWLGQTSNTPFTTPETTLRVRGASESLVRALPEAKAAMPAHGGTGH